MKKSVVFGLLALAAVFAVIAVAAMAVPSIPVLMPKGAVAQKQLDLMIFAFMIMLIVVIPVFIMTAMIAWKYRAGNTKAKYAPNWDHHHVAEAVWWGIPGLIILTLAVIIWRSSHELDPYRQLQSTKKPVTIQVVALDWKWLFIYPEQGIASVNHIEFPEDTPVNFVITSDAPMNSFWLPQLGGQVYAMSGMSTKLHLMASEQGTYNGYSANISGDGYSGMTFTATATSQAAFDKWVQGIQRSTHPLDSAEYQKIAAPSKNNPTAYYSPVSTGLYDKVVMKYMTSGSEDTAGLDHH